ncbi:hypothetical protein TNCV_1483841 [Trichonephila clavipes]|nr:hypothetical protein TNCV_1483841 [Trichonephila clavipes]
MSGNTCLSKGYPQSEAILKLNSNSEAQQSMRARNYYAHPNIRDHWALRSCHKCQIVNRRTANAYGLLQQLPMPTTPWEIVFPDHVICLPQTRAGNTNMLVRIDNATRYVVATPSVSLGALSVTDTLYHNIILRYGPLNDTPREDKLDLLILARAEAANNVYEAHLENKHRFDLHRRSHSFKDEENDSSAENQDPAGDHQEVFVTTEPSSSRNHLRRNRRPPKRFEQYVF